MYKDLRIPDHVQVKPPRDKYARICVILSLLTNKQNIVSYSLFSNKSYSVLFLTMCTTKYSHCWCRIYQNTHQGRLHCRRQFTSCQLSNKTSSSFLPFPIMSPPNMFSPPLDAYYYLRACASPLCGGVSMRIVWWGPSAAVWACLLACHTTTNV